MLPQAPLVLTIAQLSPVLEHVLPQLSTPYVVASHAGVAAEQDPFGTQTGSQAVIVLQVGPVHPVHASAFSL